LNASPSALRSDAIRNRKRILRAAAEVFAETGTDAQVIDIASRAEVGIGTLYRHFSTKDDLIYAVVNAWFEGLLEIAQRCVAIPDPAVAFRSFFTEMCASVADAAPLARALQRPLTAMPRPVDAERRVVALMGDLLRAAQAIGAVRQDIVAEDLPPLLAVIEGAARDDLYANRQWERYVPLVLDGLVTPAPSALEQRLG
jgi:AcrR family transcriptional regulator